jgi:hypothetical protein
MRVVSVGRVRGYAGRLLSRHGAFFLQLSLSLPSCLLYSLSLSLSLSRSLCLIFCHLFFVGCFARERESPFSSACHHCVLQSTLDCSSSLFLSPLFFLLYCLNGLISLLSVSLSSLSTFFKKRVFTCWTSCGRAAGTRNAAVFGTFATYTTNRW